MHLYGTAKTHNFENLDDITVGNLKSPPVTDQAAMFTYNVAKAYRII